MKYLLLLFVVILLCLGWLYERHSAGAFREPLDIPLQLAANFGELRKDHFHMGMDLRTHGVENLPVYAAADGYISHVSVSEFGLGKALYILHPNGLTTIYGHLNQFTPELEVYLHSKQYTAKCWAQDLDLPTARYPVKKGSFIAYSGNTGNSFAPHLHFEVRDTQTGRALNPLLAGFDLPDRLSPLITGLYWYDRRYSTYRLRARKIDLANGAAKASPLRINSPLISLGFIATDKSSNSSHVSGIYKARLWKDDVLVCDWQMDSFPDSATRYINACIDYPKWIRTDAYVQHLSVLPGNHLPIFKTAVSRGLISLSDKKVHRLRLEVSDIAGNHTDLSFQLQFDGSAPLLEPIIPGAQILSPGKPNELSGKYVHASFSAAAFYDTVPFILKEGPDTGKDAASHGIQLSDPSIPVHDCYSIQLRTTLRPNDALRDKVVMRLVSGDDRYVVKGAWKGDWMSGRFPLLGSIQLIVDNTPPQVAVQDWNQQGSAHGDATSLVLQCSDNMGRVASCTATLDGHWILLARKGDSFTYTFDEYCPPGQHRLEVRVKDVAGNETHQTFSFTRT